MHLRTRNRRTVEWPRSPAVLIQLLYFRCTCTPLVVQMPIEIDVCYMTTVDDVVLAPSYLFYIAQLTRRIEGNA